MEQTNLFECIYETYKIKKPIRLIELFGGIGSQAKALTNLGVDFEHYVLCEFDKYAVASYNAIHHTNFETSDITKIKASDLKIVDTDKFEYIMTYSFPCQDLSLAGNQKGMAKGSGTRSGLLWEVERLLDECTELPQILLMENVPEVIGQKNIEHFKKWQYKLERLGYSNYVECLNAKNYGIPQNRNRAFMVSILGEYNYTFPKGKKLELKLKDMLEDEVDEKFYLSDRQINQISNWNAQQDPLNSAKTIEDDYIQCLTAKGNTSMNASMLLIKESKVIDDNFTEVFDYRYDEGVRMRKDGNCPTLTLKTGSSGISGQPLLKMSNGVVVIPEKTKKGYAIAQDGDGVYTNRPHQKRGVVQKGMIQTIKTSCDDIGVIDDSKIRKLTPLECYRLMGFSDKDFEKASAVVSNSQLYKQAGNSIVVDVLEAIFKQLF